MSADHRAFLFPDFAKDLPGIRQTRFRELAIAFQAGPAGAAEKAKEWLNRLAANRMTPARVVDPDPDGELISWLRAIAELAVIDAPVAA